ncbi:hypothetical protein [Roseicitreum antarcticum]|uniref:DUF1376 domain-containing protein n=1 Tax=Roseicitreum antarcticum TaxID=564137 RepID=A0A1H3FNN6_9RHOB|nr:hypothetical protein [Roseicitreum antarcticum]SDX92008.1 hypothetical protein SAMN04488238_14312 [Roseicitreum antarcticum]
MNDLTETQEAWFYPLAMGQTLSNHDWVPLFVSRFLGSDFVIKACAEGRRDVIGTAVILWTASIRRDPAGTLPDDDVVLADLAKFGSDVDGWRRARERGALYGWRPTIVDGADHGRRAFLGHDLIADECARMYSRKQGRDRARVAQSEAVVRSRVRTKLRAMQFSKHADNSAIVEAVAGWLRQSELYVTDDNVRLALSEAVTGPRVVGGNGGEMR